MSNNELGEVAVLIFFECECFGGKMRTVRVMRGRNQDREREKRARARARERERERGIPTAISKRGKTLVGVVFLFRRFLLTCAPSEASRSWVRSM